MWNVMVQRVLWDSVVIVVVNILFPNIEETISNKTRIEWFSVEIKLFNNVVMNTIMYSKHANHRLK